MDILSKLNQTCVYWKKLGADRYNNPIFDTPIEVKCRWEDRTELFLDINGERVPSRAVVYINLLPKPGDALWKGDLDSAPKNKDVRSFAYTIRRSDEIPDIRAEIFLRMAYL
jgi:hypothetical protein